jgi:hypothetical protein
MEFTDLICRKIYLRVHLSPSFQFMHQKNIHCECHYTGDEFYRQHDSINPIKKLIKIKKL